MKSNFFPKLSVLGLILFFFVCLNACTSTLYVAPKQVDCTSISDQKCFLVRGDVQENWIMHYQAISGLDYELGFSYTLKVKKEKMKEKPADGGSFRYVLVEVLEKRDVTDDIEIDDLASAQWSLKYLKYQDVQFGMEDIAPTLGFNTEGKVNGNAGCNDYFGSFTINGRTIDLGEVGSTRKMCEDSMELEQAFLGFLNSEMRAIFNEGNLVLYGENGNKAILEPK